MTDTGLATGGFRRPVCPSLIVHHFAARWSGNSPATARPIPLILSRSLRRSPNSTSARRAPTGPSPTLILGPAAGPRHAVRRRRSRPPPTPPGPPTRPRRPRPPTWAAAPTWPSPSFPRTWPPTPPRSPSTLTKTSARPALVGVLGEAVIAGAHGVRDEAGGRRLGRELGRTVDDRCRSTSTWKTRPTGRPCSAGRTPCSRPTPPSHSLLSLRRPVHVPGRRLFLPRVNEDYPGPARRRRHGQQPDGAGHAALFLNGEVKEQGARRRAAPRAAAVQDGGVAGVPARSAGRWSSPRGRTTSSPRSAARRRSTTCAALLERGAAGATRS